MNLSETELAELVARLQFDENVLYDLAPVIVTELRKNARRLLRGDFVGESLQTTELLNELFIKLTKADLSGVWNSPRLFFGFAGKVMRNLLLDRQKARFTAKRGSGIRPISFEDAFGLPDKPQSHEWLQLALHKLSEDDAGLSRIIDLRFFLGLTHKEMATALDCSVSTVRRDIKLAVTWLRHKLS